jgi:UDP-N-acetylglucosamine transferase subunit ALG13
MIFVTVGTQLAFDRLVGTVDAWCGHHSSVPVFAQIGPTKLKVEHMEHEEFVTPEKANRLFLGASLIIAHAGMGSILTALKYRKPILIMPRKASLGEHRNDHQFATAKWLAGRQGVHVIWNENELPAFLDSHLSFQKGVEISDYASPELILNLEDFIMNKD